MHDLLTPGVVMRHLGFPGFLRLLARSYTSRVAVKDALKTQESGEITVSGWVTSVRKQKEVTFLSLNDGSCAHHLQLLAPIDSLPQARTLNLGCSVVANGNMRESTHPAQRVELHVKDLKIMGDNDPMDYPFKPRIRHTDQYIRQFPHLRARTKAFSSVLRVRHTATRAIQDFFHNKGFVYCHTPILSSSDCEGAGELFEVKAGNGGDEFFGHKTFLTVSGQLHAEALMSGMTSVYTFGPTFRAEHSHSRRHLAEFYMVEAETVTSEECEEGVEELVRLAEDLVTSTVRSVVESNADDLELVAKQEKDSKVCSIVDKVCNSPFQTLTYTEAIEALQNSHKPFEIEPEWGMDLTGEHELFLASHCGDLPLFITDFPAAIKPFYAKRSASSERQTVASLDLLVPGVGEIVGGTVREDRYDILKDRLESEGLLEQYQWYLDLRRFGSMPHGGFGLGFERLLQSILGLDNIRDVIPFPRYAGSCQL